MATTLDGAPKFDELTAMVFINKGPDFSDVPIEGFYKNPLGVPMSFEIHQSINGMYRYGYITFEDKVGVRETLPLTGNEILTIRYANNASSLELAAQPRVIHFNVYDIEESQFSNAGGDERLTDKAIKFHVIEAPFFLKYSCDVWTRSYGTPDNGMAINNIFEKHLINDLKIPNNLFSLDLQKMSTSLHFCSPAWRSQMIFNYLVQFARDEQGYGNVKFFTTSDPKTGNVVINLKSINQLFSNPKATEYTLVNASAFESGHVGIMARTMNQILTHKFVTYDLTTLASGVPGAYILNFDYVLSRYYTLKDNYKESISRKENAHFYNFGLWSDKISNAKSKSFFLGPTNKKLAKSYLNNKITEHQFQLRCETTTYVDESINPGDKIVIYFMSGMTEVTKNQQHLLDEQMSGAWIVEEIVDACANGIGYRKMVLIKDSFLNLYDVSSGVGNSKTLPSVHTVFHDEFKG